MDKVVSDIVFDFSVKPRLSSSKGNAILVAGSIYEACKYYELFQQTEFKNRCAIVTSYNPSTQDITTEDTGANTETEKEFIYKIYTDLLKDVAASQGKTKTETYEDNAKSKFVKEPANMRLLIVVDKLLTGFDAPSCTFLYIDKSMQDHGLFQAICRVNRLDTEDKQFGYIVDYKDLFKKVENAVAVYTSELDYDQFKKEDCDILLKDRLKSGRERLDNAIEEIVLLCEPVPPPKSKLDFQHYFCGNPENPDELKNTEVKRTALYKAVITLIRAYASLAAEMDEAGYTTAEQMKIKEQVEFYLKLREEMRMASGEVLDMKAYEADMRHLIDHYIQAEEPRQISPFGELSLIELIVKSGIADAINNMPNGIKGNKQAVAETIENNVRQKIIKEHLVDPAFYEEMSTLLGEIIKERKSNAIEYEEYLKKIADLAARVQSGKADNTPDSLKTPGVRAIYSNLNHDLEKSLLIHYGLMTRKPNGWRGVDTREKVVKGIIFEILGDVQETERIFDIIKKQAEY
jgi:type I restriction enzyme R subunit